MGDHDGAKAQLEEALAGRRETLGDANPDTLASMNDLGALLLRAFGDPAGATLLFREALAGLRDLDGPAAHTKTLDSARNLRNALLELGDDAGAAALASEYPGI